MGTYDRIRGDDGTDTLLAIDGTADDIWLQYDRGFDKVIGFRSGIDDDHIVVDSDEFNLATTVGFINPSEFATGLDMFDPHLTPPFAFSIIPVANSCLRTRMATALAFDAVPIAAFSAGFEDPAASNIFVFSE